jgi:hypothetical protein
MLSQKGVNCISKKYRPMSDCGDCAVWHCSIFLLWERFLTSKEKSNSKFSRLSNKTGYMDSLSYGDWLGGVNNRLLHLHHGGQCTYPCFPGVLLTSTPHNILSKPLAAFPHNHYRNNGQRLERNESCHWLSPVLGKNISGSSRRSSQRPPLLSGVYNRDDLNS